MVQILLLENKTEYCTNIPEAMESLGYRVILCSDLEQTLEELEHFSATLIIADFDCGACELTKELRSSNIITPVIVLLPEDSRPEKRQIFRSGADEYMLYPPDLEELQMRVKNLLWRCNVEADAVVHFGPCELHTSTLCLHTPDETIELRRLEFLLLEKLLSYPGRVFTRAQLMDDVWGYDNTSDPRTVDTHIRRLRQKLSKVPEIRINTVRGLGYRAVIPKRILRSHDS